jgi:hypothetical protein
MSAAAPVRSDLLPQRRRGFTPFPNEALLDWPRLVSGDAQFLSLILINSETLGVPRDRGTEPPKWSRAITTEEFAAFAHCTVRAIEIALADLSDRKVIERKKVPGKGFAYHIPFNTWPDLPDRPAPKRAELVTMPESEPAEEETQPEKTTAKPVAGPKQSVKPNTSTRPVELPCPVIKLRWERSNNGFEYESYALNGILTIRPIWQEKANAKSTKGEQSPKSTSGSVAANLKIPHVSFEKFEDMALKCQLPASKSDLVKTRKIWAGALTPDGWDAPMNAEDRANAFKGLEDRFISGEYPAKPEYRKLLVNYLKDRVWERKPRVTRKTALVARAPRPVEYDCALCFDSGLIVPNTGNQAQDLENATPCKCKAGRKRA